MNRILVLQHVPYEILGTLDPLLRGHRFRIRYINFSRQSKPKIDVDKYNGLIILGGPMGVNDHKTHPHLLHEIELIKKCLINQSPILGICLGSQLLAKALGATVRKNHQKEIGWYNLRTTPDAVEDPIFKDFDEEQMIFQWHGDTFELPKNSVLLASTSTCINQAFRYGKNAYGFQFHLEVNSELIKRWLSIPQYQRELSQLKNYTSRDQIESDTRKYIQNSVKLSEKIFLNFIHLFEKKIKPIRLGSD